MQTIYWNSLIGSNTILSLITYRMLLVIILCVLYLYNLIFYYFISLDLNYLLFFRIDNSFFMYTYTYIYISNLYPEKSYYLLIYLNSPISLSLYKYKYMNLYSTLVMRVQLPLLSMHLDLRHIVKVQFVRVQK